MTTTQYLNELETERRSIEALKPITDMEKIAWWNRLGNWWGMRDIGFGDGSGSKSHCFGMARQIARKHECEFCGDPATRVEKFDRDVFVCDECGC